MTTKAKAKPAKIAAKLVGPKETRSDEKRRLFEAQEGKCWATGMPLDPVGDFAVLRDTGAGGVAWGAVTKAFCREILSRRINHRPEAVIDRVRVRVALAERALNAIFPALNMKSEPWNPPALAQLRGMHEPKKHGGGE